MIFTIFNTILDNDVTSFKFIITTFFIVLLKCLDLIKKDGDKHFFNERLLITTLGISKYY